MRLSAGAVCAMLLLSTLAASKIIDSRGFRQLVHPLSSIARVDDGWTAVDDPPFPAGVLEKLRPSEYILRTYYRKGDVLGLLTVYYSGQRTGEAMHSPLVCLPGDGWNILERDLATVAVDGRDVEINQIHVQKDASQRVVLYWQQTRRRIIANEYAARFFAIQDVLRDGDTSGVLIRVTVRDTPEAVEAGLRFSARIIPQVQSCLGRV
jgi:EpsI family protein